MFTNGMIALERVLHLLVNYSIIAFEYIGVFILILTGIRGCIAYVKKDPTTRLLLARGMADGLEFKLGSEILRTVIVRELKEMLIVAGIILLRAALTFLIHWEITTEEKSHRQSTFADRDE